MVFVYPICLFWFSGILSSCRHDKVQCQHCWDNFLLIQLCRTIVIFRMITCGFSLELECGLWLCRICLWTKQLILVILYVILDITRCVFFLLKQNVSVSWNEYNGLWSRNVPAEFTDELLVLIVFEEKHMYFFFWWRVVIWRQMIVHLHEPEMKGLSLLNPTSRTENKNNQTNKAQPTKNKTKPKHNPQLTQKEQERGTTSTSQQTPPVSLVFLLILTLGSGSTVSIREACWRISTFHWLRGNCWDCKNCSLGIKYLFTSVLSISSNCTLLFLSQHSWKYLYHRTESACQNT